MPFQRGEKIASRPTGRQDTSEIAVSPGKPESAPKTLEALIRTIQESSEFPAFSVNIRELLTILEDPYLTIFDVSRIVLRDVSLTTQILGLVNTIYFQSYQRQVHTISSAVMLLGFNSIRDLAVGLRLFENFRQTDALVQTKQLILVSFFTAIAAQKLISRDHRFEHEEIFITALLYDFGELLTAYYFPEAYQKILTVMEQENAGKIAASRQVLGVCLDDLGLGILRLWNLPDTLLQKLSSLQQENLPEHTRDGRLRKLVRGLRTLAHGLVSPEIDPDSWCKQGEKFSKSIGLPEKTVAVYLKSSTKHFQELTRVLGVNLHELGITLPELPEEEQEEQKAETSESEVAGDAPLPESAVSAPLKVSVMSIPTNPKGNDS